VILCLRGRDPFLTEHIESLLLQDYPDFFVHIVIDHESDPARSVENACIVRLKPTNVRVEILEDSRESCSLKCSSLLHAMGRIDESWEDVALLDADASPHSTWLRELVVPLLDPGVGATTGNRWFMPKNPSIKATLRYLWNSFAICQMEYFRIAWGGSLAIKMNVVRQAGLLESWGQAFCEDTMIYSILRQQGLRLGFAPPLIMISIGKTAIRSVSLVGSPSMAQRSTLSPVVEGGRLARSTFDDPATGRTGPWSCGIHDRKPARPGLGGRNLAALRNISLVSLVAPGVRRAPNGHPSRRTNRMDVPEIFPQLHR